MAFITFSDAFLRLDASPFWAAILFLMLLLLGIDSEFGTMEAAVTPIFDTEILPKWMKKYMFTGKALGHVHENGQTISCTKQVSSP